MDKDLVTRVVNNNVKAYRLIYKLDEVTGLQLTSIKLNSVDGKQSFLFLDNIEKSDNYYNKILAMQNTGKKIEYDIYPNNDFIAEQIIAIRFINEVV